MSALIWASYISLLLLGLIDNMRGPFFPEILGDYMVGYEKGAFFFATTSALAFCGSLFAHKLLRKMTSQQMLLLSSLGLGVGFASVAVAPTFYMLMFGCGLFGLAFGALNLAQNIVVSEDAPPHSRRRLFNGLHSMYGLAALGAPLVASSFRWLGMDWRQSFLVVAALPFGWSLWAWWSLPKSKRKPVESKTSSLETTEWAVVFLYAIFISAYLWGEISISTRMVQWLRTDLQMAPDPANFYMGAFFALFLAGRLLFSFLHFHRLGNWDILRYSSLFAAVFMFLGLYYHPLFMPLSGLAMAPFYPVAMEQVNFRFSDKRAEALGFIIGFGSLSIVGLHLVLGWAGEQWGLTSSLLVCAACLGAVFLALQTRALFDSTR